MYFTHPETSYPKGMKKKIKKNENIRNTRIVVIEKKANKDEKFVPGKRITSVVADHQYRNHKQMNFPNRKEKIDKRQ